MKEQMLDSPVKEELAMYTDKNSHSTTLQEVTVPAAFTGLLRHYQHQGLNWLNFIDDYNFGGILADDMGLGKSIQIIAFILVQEIK